MLIYSVNCFFFSFDRHILSLTHIWSMCLFVCFFDSNLIMRIHNSSSTASIFTVSFFHSWFLHLKPVPPLHLSLHSLQSVLSIKLSCFEFALHFKSTSSLQTDYRKIPYWVAYAETGQTWNHNSDCFIAIVLIALVRKATQVLLYSNEVTTKTTNHFRLQSHQGTI